MDEETHRYNMFLYCVLLIILTASGYVLGYAQGHGDTIGAMKKLTANIEEVCENIFEFGYNEGYNQ